MNQSIRTDLYIDLFLFKVNVGERRILSLGFSFFNHFPKCRHFRYLSCEVTTIVRQKNKDKN